MVNTQVIKRILKEKGPIGLIIDSTKQIWYNLSWRITNMKLNLICSLRKPITDKKGEVSIVFINDAEGPKYHSVNDTWEKIDLGYKLIGPRINNFVVDWPGEGYSNFEKYKEMGPVYWHYHHPGGAVDWGGEKIYEKDINYKIMEYKSFPVIFRAGHTYEGEICEDWLDKWIPFDYSSRAPYTFWENCVSDWEPVHKHNRRYIFRSLDAEFPKWSKLSEVDKAFKLSLDGKKVFISFFSHDYKDFLKHYNYINLLLKCASKRYPNVKYEFKEVLNSIRTQLGFEKRKPLKLTIIKNEKWLDIRTNRPIYQNIPYIVLDQGNGTYIHSENIESVSECHWKFPYPILGIKRVGIAVSDEAGYSTVEVLE